MSAIDSTAVQAIGSVRHHAVEMLVRITEEASTVRRAIVRVTDRLEVAIDRLERAALARMERP